MNLVLDLLQGAGVAAAAGIRPFLPTLLVGGLASADLGVDFDGTQFSFLEEPWFLLVVAAAMAVGVLARRRFESGPGEAAMQGVGIGLGALLYAGTLDDRFDTWWPGIVLGIAFAALGSVAARTLLGRVRTRLDAAAAGALFLYAEAFALLLAGLSVALPPLAIAGVGFLGFLLRGGRRREGEKYAGLRILR
jgi:hypothetical protein